MNKVKVKCKTCTTGGNILYTTIESRRPYNRYEPVFIIECHNGLLTIYFHKRVVIECNNFVKEEMSLVITFNYKNGLISFIGGADSLIKCELYISNLREDI